MDCFWLERNVGIQVARVLDIEQDKVKIEMLGHENVVECASFVPRNCVPALQELVALVGGTTASSPISDAEMQTSRSRQHL